MTTLKAVENVSGNGFQACVFEGCPEDSTPCMASEVAESEIFYKLIAWLDTRRKQVLWVVLGMVIIGLAVAFVFWKQGQKQLAANEALSKITSAETLVKNPKGSADALVAVANQYPDTDAGGRALVLAGGDFFKDGKFADAKTQFQKYLTQHRDGTFAPQASLGVAACQDALGQTNEAIASYLNITQRFPNDNVTLQARLSLGRLYEAGGKLQQARDAYEQMLRAVGSYGAEARMRWQELVTKHPELLPSAPVPTNSPALHGTNLSTLELKPE